MDVRTIVVGMFDRLSLDNCAATVEWSDEIWRHQLLLCHGDFYIFYCHVSFWRLRSFFAPQKNLSRRKLSVHFFDLLATLILCGGALTEENRYQFWLTGRRLGGWTDTEKEVNDLRKETKKSKKKKTNSKPFINNCFFFLFCCVAVIVLYEDLDNLTPLAIGFSFDRSDRSAQITLNLLRYSWFIIVLPKRCSSAPLLWHHRDKLLVDLKNSSWSPRPPNNAKNFTAICLWCRRLARGYFFVLPLVKTYSLMLKISSHLFWCYVQIVAAPL